MRKFLISAALFWAAMEPAWAQLAAQFNSPASNSSNSSYSSAYLPTRKPAQLLSPEPAAYWQGAYVGVQGGLDFGAKTWGLGGARAGYNWQRENFVVGVQGDANWRPDSGNSEYLWTGAATGTHYKADTSLASNFLSTLTARAGYVIGERWLPFVSAGAVLTDVGANTTVVGLTGPEAGAYGHTSFNDLRASWTVGAGLEYAISRDWSVEGQYQYFHAQTFTHTTEAYLQGVEVSGFKMGFEGGGNLATLGVNYHF